jgi:outer membrane protein
MLKFMTTWLMMVSFSLLLLSSFAIAQNDSPLVKLTLDDAVSLALKNSDLIRQAKEAIAVQEEIQKSSQADLFPSVSAGYRYTHLKDDPYMIVEHQVFPIDDVNQFNWNVTLRQPLFTGFALTSRNEMEKIGIDVKNEEKRLAMLAIVQAVKKAYFNILLAGQFQKTADEAVIQLTAHAEDADHFYHQGLIPYNDVLKSQVALADAVQNAATAKSRVDLTVSAFNILVGFPLDSETDVVDVTTLPSIPDGLDSLISEALHNQPAVQAMRLTQQQADLAVQLAKSAYYPDIYLTGMYEQRGQNADASENDYANWQNAGVSIAAQWEFLTWGKRKADVMRRIHEKDALSARLHEIEDNIRLEVKRAYLDLALADKNIRTAEKALSQAKENYRITNVQYQENIAASTDVIDARTDLTRTESNYYSALYGYQIAAADLDRAVGRSSWMTSENTDKAVEQAPTEPSDIQPVQP